MAQAIDALRHGWPLRMIGGPRGDGLVLLPVETAITAKADSAQMLISSARAATLKLINQREAAAPHAPVLIHGAELFTLAAARPIADPALDLASPLKGPFRAETIDWPDEAEAALELARLAGILPAFLVDPKHAGEAQPVAACDLAQWSEPAKLAIATRAHLPIAACENAEIVAFRSVDDTREHVALVIGTQTSDRAPLVRLHSECLTGDILGSLKCDCGPQLDAALAAMAQEARGGGWGVLLYMRQEGRGIGLVNKLKAYQLQDQGRDTIEANHALGFGADLRHYGIGAQILVDLGLRNLRLLTNNPKKIVGIDGYGLRVLERLPLEIPATDENRKYLRTKSDKLGHILPLVSCGTNSPSLCEL